MSRSSLQRIAILVVGPHRCGTSAFTRVIGMMGATLPKRLMPVKADNERGFWEPEEVVRLHDEILASVGSRWDDVSDFPATWFASPAAAPYRARIKTVLDADFGKATLLVVKDPRLARVVPLWIDACDEMHVDSRFVVPVRNALEAAASLTTRNGFTTARGLLIWLRHILAAERDTRGRPRSFVLYADLLHDWRGVLDRIGRDLDLHWPNPSHKTTMEVERFLSASLRHHDFPATDVQTRADVVSWVAQTHTWLEEACAGRRPEPERLDEIRRKLDEADLAFGPILAELQAGQTAMEACFTADLAAMSQSLAESACALDATRRSLEEQGALLATRDTEIVELRHLHSEASAELERAQKDNAAQSEAIDELEEAHRKVEDSLEASQTELAKAKTELANSKSELAAAQALAEERIHVIEDIGYHYTEIQRTLGWRALEGMRRVRERVLPEGFTESYGYQLVRKGLVTVMEDGPLSAGLMTGRSLLRWLKNSRAHPARSLAPDAEVTRPSGLEESLTRQIYNEATTEYQPRSERPVSDPPVKVIAFYLPQFHPIPENDVWWGPGFTEWTNVTRARPQFLGHYQPRLPSDLGFYDLRVPDVQARQIELARHYGIHGFCLHYYWFNGKRLLYRPLEQLLQNPSLDFPFCICWANENWTRRWDGQENEVLIAQRHSPESDAAFIRDAAHILQDPRYVRIDGRPLLVVYRPNILPNVKDSVARWREFAQKAGMGDLFLVAAQTFGFQDPRPLGFDGAVEFPPHGVVPNEITQTLQVTNPRFSGHVYSYADVVKAKSVFKQPGYPLFKTVMPSWDNTARRGASGFAYLGGSPQMYQQWLETVAADTMNRLPTSAQYVFINAWNEWAEGAYLEPDRAFGYAYLNATAGALDKARARRLKPGRSQPRISVVIPAYNHETYVAAALESVAAQDVRNLEVVVVNDGSTDRTADVVRAFADKNPGLALELIEQPNAGAHAALNRGISCARGDYVALLNSDDYYHSERLDIMLSALKESPRLLAFSDIDIVDDRDEPVGDEHDLVRVVREKIAGASKQPSIGYALLDFNIAVTTGNFVFRRELFSMIGGFRDLKYCHDWDFLLTALRFTEPLFVDRRLYSYRLHANNSFRALQDLAESDSEAVLSRFFAYEQQQAIVRTGFPSHLRDGSMFAEFVRAHGYRKYLTLGSDSSAADRGARVAHRQRREKRPVSRRSRRPAK